MNVGHSGHESNAPLPLPLLMTHLPLLRAPPVPASDKPRRWRGILLAFFGRHPLPTIALLIIWRP